MSRIRTIKPEFFEDEELAKLPPHDRLLFIGLWTLADKNGVVENRPEWIQVKIFPYEKGEAPGKHPDVSQMLPRLVSGKFIIPYFVNDKKYFFIPGFTRHQRINGKEAASNPRYPLPDVDLATLESMGQYPGSTREAPGNTPDTSRVPRKGREGKGKDIPPMPSAEKKVRVKSPEQECVSRHAWKIKGNSNEKKMALKTAIEKYGIDAVDAKDFSGKWASDVLKIMEETEICPHENGSPQWLDWHAMRGMVV